MAMHPRRRVELLVDRLARPPVTVPTGARQTGKTTLARDLLPASGGPAAVYFPLDDPEERLRLAADPVRRLDHGARLVVLEEVQKQPGLLDAVKLLADRGEGRRFLLLDFAQILPLHGSRSRRRSTSSPRTPDTRLLSSFTLTTAPSRPRRRPPARLTAPTHVR